MTKICPNLDCPDIELFGVRGEYLDSLVLCPKCGTTLVESAPTSQPANVDARADVSEGTDPLPPEEGSWFYVGAFRDLPAAHLARGLLLSAGIFAELLDEATIGIDWFYSQAVHGVKVVVKADGPEASRELLDADARNSLESIPEMAQPATVYEQCPRCGSGDVSTSKWTQLLKVVSFAYIWAVLFVPVARHFQPTTCQSCGRRWHPQWTS